MAIDSAPETRPDNATAKDPYLSGAIGKSERLIGRARRRLKTQPSFSYIKHNQNEGCVPLLYFDDKREVVGEEELRR